MKSLQQTLTPLLLLTVLLFAGAARAQTATPLIRINVPFEFQVGNKLLPAGDYSVCRANPYILVVRDSRQRVVATLVTTPAQTLAPPTVPKLAFRVQGTRNVLTHVWLANSRYGFEFPASHTRPLFAQTPTSNVQAAAGR
jgi:hypothetical protein